MWFYKTWVFKVMKVSQACEVTGSESNVTHKIIANKILANKDENLQEKESL